MRVVEELEIGAKPFAITLHKKFGAASLTVYLKRDHPFAGVENGQGSVSGVIDRYAKVDI